MVPACRELPCSQPAVNSLAAVIGSGTETWANQSQGDLRNMLPLGEQTLPLPPGRATKGGVLLLLKDALGSGYLRKPRSDVGGKVRMPKTAAERHPEGGAEARTDAGLGAQTSRLDQALPTATLPGSFSVTCVTRALYHITESELGFRLFATRRFLMVKIIAPQIRLLPTQISQSNQDT